jgi:hypothetical protein
MKETCDKCGSDIDWQKGKLVVLNSQIALVSCRCSNCDYDSVITYGSPYKQTFSPEGKEI